MRPGTNNVPVWFFVGHRLSLNANLQRPKRLEMFLWKGKQTVFILLLLFVCTMSLIHPVWRYWYEMIFPPLFIVIAILALIAIIRPE
jgi:hypothetical protein